MVFFQNLNDEINSRGKFDVQYMNLAVINIVYLIVYRIDQTHNELN